MWARGIVRNVGLAQALQGNKTGELDLHLVTNSNSDEYAKHLQVTCHGADGVTRFLSEANLIAMDSLS